MLKHHKQLIEVYRRVQGFIAAHPLKPPATYGESVDLLDDVIANLEVQAGRQEGSRRLGLAETRQLKTYVAALRVEHLRPIAKIARAVLRNSPGIDVGTRLPDRGLPLEKLIATAAAFRAAALPYESTFVKHGCPPDFIAQLDAAVAKVKASVGARYELVRNRTGARAAMQGEAKRGRDAVEMLDGIVKRAFAGDSAVFAEWRAVRKLHGIASASSGAPSAAGPARPTADTTEAQPVAKAA